MFLPFPRHQSHNHDRPTHQSQEFHDQVMPKYQNRVLLEFSWRLMRPYQVPENR